MTDTKPEMKRDSTMQVTAKEGIKFLKDAGETVLLDMQGLNDPPDDGASVDVEPIQKPKFHRDSTMAATIKDGEAFLKDQDKKGSTESLPNSVSTESTKSTNETKKETKKGKSKMTKASTMMQTKKEGEAFLASQEKLKDEPPVKKSKVEKAEKSNNKRLNTIVRTAKEGEELLKRMGMKNSVVDGERRITRAQARGEPAPVAAPTSNAAKKNAKQGDVKDEPKRRGKAKKEAPVKVPEDEEDESEKEEEEEGKDEEMEEEKNETTKENKSNVDDEKDKKKDSNVKNDKASNKKETAAQKKKNNVVQKKKGTAAN